MFDFALSEMLLAALAALVVLGPERLPKAAQWLGRTLGRVQAWTAKWREGLREQADWQSWQQAADSLRGEMKQLQEAVLPAWERLPEPKTPADFGLADDGTPLPVYGSGFHALSPYRRSLLRRRSDRMLRRHWGRPKLRTRR